MVVALLVWAVWITKKVKIAADTKSRSGIFGTGFFLLYDDTSITAVHGLNCAACKIKAMGTVDIL